MGDSDGDKGEANSWSQGTQKSAAHGPCCRKDEVVDLELNVRDQKMGQQTMKIEVIITRDKHHCEPSLRRRIEWPGCVANYYDVGVCVKIGWINQETILLVPAKLTNWLLEFHLC